MVQDEPALHPPPGVSPNFSNPPNGNVGANVGIAICLFLMAFAVPIRIYSKVFCMKQVKAEDVLAFLAIGPYVGFVHGCYWIMISSGYYVHQWDVRLNELSTMLYIIYTSTPLYEGTMMTIKSAILMEWVRIFVPRGTRNSFSWMCYTLLCANVIYYTASILVSAFACSPHERNWNKSLPGTCINTKAILISSPAINLVSDLLILVLPQRLIWTLHMSKRKKINISLVFMIGILACISATVRLTEAVKYYQSDDVVYCISAVSLWCLAEATCAFLVFCVPAAPKVFSSHKWTKRVSEMVGAWSAALMRQTKENASSSWYGSNQKTPSPKNKYRKFDEREIPLQYLRSTGIAAAESSRQSHDVNTPGSGIIRTIRLETRENHVPRDISNGEHTRQHLRNYN
ncbi:hypothetical protein F4779DRAFT_570835 [Xylariaceae sp. FL0662B]|nr:hypothetical protein F4779DRAFT_570835 [Xylariaceae sp. FL0662B]